MSLASRCVLALRRSPPCARWPAAGAAPSTRAGSRRETASPRQAALDALHGSNVSLQVVTTTKIVESIPATCRVHLLSKNPATFRVYVFWIPWLGSEAYTWLDMKVTKDPAQDTFVMGTAKPVLPGGLLTANGRSVDPFSQDTTILSRYGPQQAKKNRDVLMAHAGNAFQKPGARCQALSNGDLRLVPNP